MELDLFHETPDPTVCKFYGCSNETAGIMKVGLGKQTGQVSICEQCMKRWETEKPVVRYYVCGQLGFIKTIVWNP